jgi:xanthine/uracil permease
MQLILEAIVVGIVITVIGYLVSLVIQLVMDRMGVKRSKNTDWNKYHVMEIALFLTGFIAHLLFEIVGLNKWYCTSGHSCLKKKL